VVGRARRIGTIIQVKSVIAQGSFMQAKVRTAT
jgi:hypothetical protein